MKLFRNFVKKQYFKIALKTLKFILPPFHPLKYKYIALVYGIQSKNGGWKDIDPKKDL